jgi:DNA-binding CsgD family transcriptional regulator
MVAAFERVRRSVLHGVRRQVPVDAAFFAFADPETLLFSAAFAEAPLVESGALFLENELRGGDANRFVDLARADVPVATLDRATRGAWSKSARWRELLAGAGLGDEMRVALRAGDATWGFLCLHRAGRSPFAPREIDAVRRAARDAAVAIRGAVASVVEGPRGTDEGVNAVVLVDGEIVSGWTGRLPIFDGRPLEPNSRAPLQVLALVRRLEAAEREGSEPSPYVQTLLLGPASFVEARAERLHRSSTRSMVAVTFTPVAPRALSSLRLAASGATKAQRRVAVLVLRGHSTKEVSTALRIGEHTVQDHLKAVFARFGVSSRRELVAALTR